MLKAVKAWAVNVLMAFDQLINAFFGGDHDETISSRAAKARNKGHRWGCVLCRVIDFFDHGHCDGAVEADEGSNAL